MYVMVRAHYAVRQIRVGILAVPFSCVILSFLIGKKKVKLPTAPGPSNA